MAAVMVLALTFIAALAGRSLFRGLAAGAFGLLCATVADAMRVGERHDSNRELFGQGIANVVTPMFGGVPATAAIARTAVSIAFDTKAASC